MKSPRFGRRRCDVAPMMTLSNIYAIYGPSKSSTWVGEHDASPSHSESHVLMRFSSSSVSTAVIQVGKWKGPLLDEYFALSHTRSISRARLFLDPIGTFQGNCLRCRCRTAGPAKFGERSLPEAYWSRIGRIYGKLRISDASGIPTASRFRKNGGAPIK